MIEFVIIRLDGDGLFDLPYSQWERVLRPSTMSSVALGASQTAHHVIEVEGYSIRLVDEMPGLAVIIDSEQMPYKVAKRVVEKILENITQETGSAYQLLEMPPDKPFRFG